MPPFKNVNKKKWITIAAILSVVAVAAIVFFAIPKGEIIEDEPIPGGPLSDWIMSIINSIPTIRPTATPTLKPTATPTLKPTATPTLKPTATPTLKPTATPTLKPTATPTLKPTATPTLKPTATPTLKPTATPTLKPTATPTPKPTATPTPNPTATPTPNPTATPTPQETSFQSIASLKSSNSLKIGDTVKTLGYYANGDGGGASYRIAAANGRNDNGGTILLTANGLAAEMIIENDTVSVLQFGALADGATDDWKAIENALASPAGTVSFPSGKSLMVRNNLHIGHSNIRLEGNGATLLMDDAFTGWEEFYLGITDVTDVSIDQLNIFFTQKKNPGPYFSQIGVLRASRVSITNCELRIPEEATDIRSVNNIDLYSDWHDVEISNNRLYLAHDGEEGLCIQARDFFGANSGGLRVFDNDCYKVSHDEIMGIYAERNGSVSDVIVRGNTFTMRTGAEATTSNICVSLGIPATSSLSSILIERNTFDIESMFCGFNISSPTNDLVIRDNNINYRRGERARETTDVPSTLFTQDNGFADRMNGLQIVGNDIRIDNRGLYTLDYFANVAATFENNNITVDGDIKGYLFGENVYAAENNTINISGDLECISTNVREGVVNNNVNVDGQVNFLFRYLFTTLEASVEITENQIYGQSAAPSGQLINVIGLTTNGNAINIDDNIIDIPGSANFLYAVDMIDTAGGVVFGENNVISGNYTMEYAGTPDMVVVAGRAPVAIDIPAPTTSPADEADIPDTSDTPDTPDTPGDSEHTSESDPSVESEEIEEIPDDDQAYGPLADKSVTTWIVLAVSLMAIAGIDIIVMRKVIVRYKKRQ